MTDELLLKLIALQRENNDLLYALRADLRRVRSDHDLRTAWREEIGPAPMTTARVLRWIEDDPHGPVAVAAAALVDLDAPGRAVSLGRLLARQSWLESTQSGGVLTYRQRGD